MKGTSTMKSLRITTSLIALLCAGATPALAQEPAPADNAVDTQGGNIDDIIVTGRAGTDVRTKAETS